MALEIHAVVEHSADLDLAIWARPVKQEMPRIFHSSDALGDAISTVPEMIRPRGGSYFRTFVASGPIRILDHIADRLHQKRFVTQPGGLAEMFVRPTKNGFHITLGGCGKDVPPHESCPRATFHRTGGAVPDLGDEVRKLPLAVELDALTLIELVECLRRQGTQHGQFLPFLAGLLLQ